MSRTKELVENVLDLCNQVFLTGEPVHMPNMSAEEWNGLLQITAEQGLLPIVAPSLCDLSIEDEAARMNIMQWYVTASEYKMRYKLCIYNMRVLSTWMAQEGIDIMFMKGAALAQLYPDPELRMFSDIDFYLYGKSEEGIEAMRKHGIESNPYAHHHTLASLNGVLLENHYDFVERAHHPCDIIIDDALKELADKEGKNIEACFLGSEIHNAYVMTPTMNAIFLMRHMSAHFASETISLRQLYDWALFLQKKANNVDWKMVVELYEQSGMMLFAGIIQQLLHEHLQIDSDVSPVKPVDNELTDKVWESIVFPPKHDSFEMYSWKYYLFEARIFIGNRWKYKIVYPDESYTLLFFKYAWSGIRKMTGLLKTEN